MNILTRIKAAMFPKIVEASLPGGSLEFFRRLGKPPDVSQEALVRKYWGWVQMCVHLSATRVASTPLKVYASRGKGEPSVKHFATRKVDGRKSLWLRKRIGKSLAHVAGSEDFEELEEHPIIDLLAKVNDQENGYELREMTSTMLDLTGNGYWYVERGQMGVPSRIFLLRSQWVRIIPDKKLFISGYLYGTDQLQTDQLELKPGEVIHFKYPNPSDAWYGMGPVQAAAYSVEGQRQRELFMIAVMANMARPDLIVRYIEGELDPAERSTLEREWNTMFKGPKAAGKVKVTDSRYEIEKVGWTPQELRFDQGEEWIMKKICGAFPVPVGLVDTTQISRAPRAGMEGADLFMAQFNTLPRCTRIEEKINEKLCPMFDERLFVAFEDPVPKDKAWQLKEDTARLGAYLTTVNEIRERDGEDAVPWGDVPLAASGIVPLGSTQPGPEPGAGAITDEGAPANTPPGPDGSPGGTSFEKAVAKIVGQGVTMEVEGQYVHPTLEGVPVILRPATRNERGRFDRLDGSRLWTRRGEDRGALRRVFGSVKGDDPGHPFRGNQYGGGTGGGGGGDEERPVRRDRNDDEASDARYFKRERAKLDRTISDIKQKIATNEVKIAEVELAAVQAALAKVREAKASIEAKHAVVMDRMEALRQEWESKFPGKPLPKAARRKGESGGLEERILAAQDQLLDIEYDMEQLGAKAEALLANVSKPARSVKGDEEGHPFRGNQYTGGIGGGGADDKPASRESGGGFDPKKWSAMDMQARREAWSALSQPERDRMADAPRSVPARQKELLAGVLPPPSFTQGVSLSSNIAARANHYAAVLPKDTVDRIGVAATKYNMLLQGAGGTSEARHELVMAAMDALASQELEGMGRQLGDHGETHILSNATRAMEIMEAVPGADTDLQRAEVFTAMVFHDTGYLTAPSRAFLDEGHPRWSTENYNTNYRGLVAKALGQKSADNISHLIRTHDSTDINWEEDAVGSAVRVADNLAVFAKEKLPPVFRVPGNKEVLLKLSDGSVTLEQARAEIEKNVQALKVPARTKERLLEAGKEVTAFTPKFTLGMLGGEVIGVKWEEGHIAVKLRERQDYTKLQKVLDLGQKQFTKLAKTFDADPEQFKKDLRFSFTKNGKVRLTSEIVETIKSFIRVIEAVSRKAQS